MDNQELVVALTKSPEEVMQEMRAELYKRAKGYDVEEVTKSTGPEGPRVVMKKRHIPGDPHAMVEYMHLFGNETGGVVLMGEKAWQNIKPGDVFGRLTVVAFAGKTDSHRPAFFCNCKCGVMGYIADAAKLLNGSLISCNRCRPVKILYGPRCPYPCNGCKKNKRGLCCHECEEEFTCKDACKSSTVPYPNGCGRGKVVGK